MPVTLYPAVPADRASGSTFYWHISLDNAQSIAHGLQLSAISYQLQLQLQPSAAKASEKLRIVV
jgi:hypothetical protein